MGFFFMCVCIFKAYTGGVNVGFFCSFSKMLDGLRKDGATEVYLQHL